MKNENQWKPTKFKINNGKWLPDGRYVGLGSRYITNLTIPFYKSYIEKICQGKLLDCGCGNVPYYGIYKNQVESVTCIDWAESFHKNPYLDHIVDLNKDQIPEADNYFDSVLLADVLEHLYKPHHALSEVSRVLKPGGKVLIVVPFFYWLHETPHDYYRFTKFALKELCAQSGLKIVNIEESGGLPDIILDLLSRAYVKNNRRLRWFSSIAFRINKMKWFKRFRNNTKEKFPLSYFVVATKQ